MGKCFIQALIYISPYPRSINALDHVSYRPIIIIIILLVLKVQQ